MPALLSTVVLALLSGQAPDREAPLWLTFEVLNRRTNENHSILHLGDVIGPRAKKPGKRAVLIFSATLDQCGRKVGGLCSEVEKIAREAFKEEGLVVGVILAGAESAPRVKREIPYTNYSFPISVDAHGILGHALNLDRPGVFLVINSSTRIVRLLPPSQLGDRENLDRFLSEVRTTLLEALRREEER